MSADDIFNICLLALLMLGAGWLWGIIYQSKRWEKAMIHHGLAHYDARTGEWMWDGKEPLWKFEEKP